MNSLWLILLLTVFAWLWLDSARAREMATEVARSMCRKRGLQFLDDTVGLQRVGLRWTHSGLRLRRMFGFDFSVEGAGRRSGWLILVGTSVEQFDLGLPRPSAQPDPDTANLESSREQGPANAESAGQQAGQAPAKPQDNVVPFKKRDPR